MAKKVTVAISTMPSGPRPRPEPAPQLDGWKGGTTRDYGRSDQPSVSFYGARVDDRLRQQDRWGYPDDLDPEDDHGGWF